MMLAEIISPEFFIAKHQLLLWGFSAFAIVLLVIGSDKAVTAAVKLASAMGMSTVLIGATVVSLGTTSPEAFVSVNAAFKGQPGLALGNGIGSVICDTALIFGLCCCLARLPKDKFILNRHGWLQLGSGLLLAVILGALAWVNGGFTGVVIPRWVGGFLVACLVGYLAISVHWAKQHPRLAAEEALIYEEKGKDKSKFVMVVMNLLWLAFGLGLVVFGADILVGSAGELCVQYGVPSSVLAVTLIAFGTSVPELATAIASLVKGHPELLVGNVIGADILNVLFVIGASGTAVRLEVPVEFYYLHVPVMLVGLIMFRLFIFAPGKTFRRWQGIPLLALFASYYAALMVLVNMGILKV